jgi:poly-gamma-glutamate synthase PgsB/CapB
LPILREQAKRRDCRLIAVDPESVSDREMRGFSWITFKENVAIAIAVAELAGVNRRDALQGMYTAPPDPGVLTVKELDAGGKRLRFANVFAANDPESTLQNIRQLGQQGLIRRPLHVIINCRPDRVERNAQMGALIGRLDPDGVLLIGEPTRSARAQIPRQWQDRVVDLGGRQPAGAMLDGLLRHIGDVASIVAVGNIHGQGEVLIEELSRLPETDGGSRVPRQRIPAPSQDRPAYVDRRVR